MAKDVTTREGGDVQQQPQRTVLQEIRADIDRMKPEFAVLLPKGTEDRFVRNVVTCIQKNEKLLRCTKKSLYGACMEAANDQLQPDGKEGAIIPYGEDEDGRGKSDIARWMPMIAGIRKKALGSGKLSDWNVQCVYEGDEFDFQLGDDPFIHHKPSMRGGRTRKVIAAYSIATFPDGTKSREVMNGDMIADIAKKSKSKRGPWSDPVFYGEMARKTVGRLHAKQLPTWSDLESVFSRDDDLYDLTATVSTPPDKRPRIAPASARAVLDHFAQGDDTPAPGANNDTTELPSPPTQADVPADRDVQDQQPAPTNEAEYRAYAEAHIDAATGDPRDLNEWWSSPDQRKMRNACAVLRDTFDTLVVKVRDKCTALEGAA